MRTVRQPSFTEGKKANNLLHPKFCWCPVFMAGWPVIGAAGAASCSKKSCDGWLAWGAMVKLDASRRSTPSEFCVKMQMKHCKAAMEQMKQGRNRDEEQALIRGSQTRVHLLLGVHLPIWRGPFEVSNRRKKLFIYYLFPNSYISEHFFQKSLHACFLIYLLLIMINAWEKLD